MKKEINTKKLLEHTGNFQDYLIETLKNPEEALVYLQVALDEYQIDKHRGAFMLALRNVAEAMGGLGQLSQKTKMTRQHLYHALSIKGNPRLDTLETILGGLGLHLSVAPLPKASKGGLATSVNQAAC